jgi:uncharacterized protein (DUF934 family)
MRRILRRHDWSRGSGDVPGGEVIPDEWRLFGEDASETDPLIVPLAELRKDTAAWLARKSPLGVKLAPAESVESLADVLQHLRLVAVEFPNISDGRGFSYARLLRERFGFKGELRAVGGAVKQDKIFLLARCGFDSFELPPTEKADEAQAALHRYDVVYQPGEPVEGIRHQRYFSQ